MDVPETEREAVVEGVIETGRPPYVVLTKTTRFFEPNDPESFGNSFIHNARVTVQNGADKTTLNEYCISDIQDPNLKDTLLPV
ncbi:MAG: hypothetical protein ABEH43_02580, partial [Flavobacteriales bacterium]